MYRQSKSVASNLGTRPSPRSLMLVVGCWQTCFSKPSLQQSGYKQDALCQPLWTRSALGTGKMDDPICLIYVSRFPLMQLGYVSCAKTAKNKGLFSFSSIGGFFPQSNRRRVGCLLVLRVSLRALGTFGKHKIKAPLLPSEAPSLKWRLTQLTNVITFKAHLNPFITIIHSPELSEFSHQSHYAKKPNSTGFIHGNGE